MSLCATCALTGKTCCHQTDVVLTQGDVLRIHAYSGRGDFWECRPPRDPSALGSEGDPHWLSYTLRPDGTRRVLRHKAAQECIFLSPKGCVLPTGVRPLICRLHPASYTEEGLAGTAAECPVHLLPQREGLLVAVGIDLDSARKWHAQLYQELRQEAWGRSRAA